MTRGASTTLAQPYIEAGLRASRLMPTSCRSERPPNNVLKTAVSHVAVKTLHAGAQRFKETFKMRLAGILSSLALFHLASAAPQACQPQAPTSCTNPPVRKEWCVLLS